MKDDETTAKARRDLDRLAQEGGLSASPALRNKATSVRDHFTAADADPADPIEIWGTRIARALALVGFILLAVWLYFRYMR